MRLTLTLPLLALLAAPAAAEPDAKPLADAVNQLGLDLYPRIKAREANVFYSPFSISAALTMTREGARGKTAAEMDEVLHLPANRAQAYRALIAGLQPRTVKEWTRSGQKEVKTFSLSIANRLFGQVDFPFEDPFLKLLKTDYAAPMQRIDFGQPARARKTINDWVAKNTRDRIQDIVPEGKPTPDCRLALANAIHFKAGWQHAFRGTQTKPFHTLDGKEVSATLMQSLKRYRYYADDAVAVAELPYRHGDTSMVVILPKARKGLPAVTKGLTRKQLDAWRQAARPRHLDVRLPKFEVTTSCDLASVLPEMGMKRAFTGAADFSGMTRADRLFIGAVLHKAFVKVDEQGTEAAAATVVLMKRGAARRPPPPTPFVADHPFLFLIRHNKTGCVMFMGRVGDPTQKS